MRRKYYSDTTESMMDSETVFSRSERQNTFTEEIPAEVESTGPETKNGTIANSSLVNVRSEPTLNSRVVDTLRKGDKVKIIGKVGEFYMISSDSDTPIYILSKYVSEE